MSALHRPLPASIRQQAINLAAAGWSYRQIGTEVGIDESQIRRDPAVREARIKADPNAHSVTNPRDTIACRLQPATELISRVEWTLASLLGSDYSLSSTDRRRLRGLLASAIERIDS